MKKFKVGDIIRYKYEDTTKRYRVIGYNYAASAYTLVYVQDKVDGFSGPVHLPYQGETDFERDLKLMHDIEFADKVKKALD